MYNVGDLVVYPSQGVGRIESIGNQKIGDMVCDLYVVYIEATKITIMVPVRSAVAVGLRVPVDKDTAASILEALRTDERTHVNVGQNWNRRFREYSERLKSPDLRVVAGVLQELLILSRAKPLSYGEKLLEEQALQLVSDEIALVLGMDGKEIRSELHAKYAPPPREPDGRLKKQANAPEHQAASPA